MPLKRACMDILGRSRTEIKYFSNIEASWCLFRTKTANPSTVLMTCFIFLNNAGKCQIWSFRGAYMTPTVKFLQKIAQAVKISPVKHFWN